MHHVGTEAREVLDVRTREVVAKTRVVQALAHRSVILLLKDSAVFAQKLLAVFAVETVLGHLIDKEQRETLDATLVEPFLLSR